MNYSKSFVLVLSVLVLTIVMGAGGVHALPTVSIGASCPVNASTFSAKNFSCTLNSTSTLNLDNFIVSVNNVNYTGLSKNLIFAYNLDNRSARGENEAFINDSSSNGNTLTLRSGNIINVSGRYNGAITFNGTGGGAFRTATTGFSINDPQTVCLSFNTYDANSITTLYGNSFSASNRTGLTTQSNQIRAGFYNGTQYFSIAPVGNITNGLWYRVCYTNNGTGLDLYLNGIKQGNNRSAPSLSANLNMSIGIATDGNTKIFNGTIDEVRGWNIALTDSQILQDYQMNYLQYDSQNRSIYLNLTNILNGNYNLIGYVNDTASQLNTTTRTFTVQLTSKVTTLFSSTRGVINNFFYGINTEGALTSLNQVSNDLDCSVDSISNYNLTRQALDNLGMNNIRYVMRLDLSANQDGTFVTNTTVAPSGAVPIYSELMSWAYENNQSLLIVAGEMPSWIGNKTAGWCYSDNATCPPINATLYANTVVSWINNVTNQGQYNSSIKSIEVGNEISGVGDWMINVPAGNPNRSIQYNLMYNATYSAIKARYPNIEVGGIGVDSPDTPVEFNNWLGNFTLENKIDFVSYHRYYRNTSNFTIVSEMHNWVLSRCAVYGTNCTKVYPTEFNLDFRDGMQNSTLKNAFIANTYAFYLNNNSANIKSNFYKFDSRFRNLSCDSTSNVIVFEQFTPTYFPSYGVIANITRQNPVNSTVANSSSDSGDIVTTSGRFGSICSNTIINTWSDSYYINNETWDPSLCGPLAMDMENGTLYVGSSGNFTAGLLQGYDIMYHQTPNLTLSEPAGGLNKSNYLGEMIGGIGNEITITATDEVTKQINSSLSTSTNISIIASLNCHNLQNITINATTSGYFDVLSSGSDFSCSNNQVTITTAQVDGDSQLIVMTAGYYSQIPSSFCSSGTGIILQLTVFFFALGLPILAAPRIKSKIIGDIPFAEMNRNQMITLFVVIMVYVPLVVVVANIVGGLC